MEDREKITIEKEDVGRLTLDESGELETPEGEIPLSELPPAAPKTIEDHFAEFDEAEPLPGAEHLGRAIVDKSGRPSGSPANYEELRAKALLENQTPEPPSEEDLEREREEILNNLTVE